MFQVCSGCWAANEEKLYSSQNLQRGSSTIAENRAGAKERSGAVHAEWVL